MEASGPDGSETMPRFIDVLAEVGHKAGDEEGIAPHVRVNTSGWSAWMAPGERRDEPVEHRLSDDYGDEPNLEGAGPIFEQPREEPIDLAIELDAGRLQSLPLRELRALRRRLARHVHPDVMEGQGADIDPQAMGAQLVGVGRPVRR